MEHPRVVLLLPSAYRPKWLERCLDSLYTVKGTKPDRVVASVFSDDLESLHICTRFHVDVVVRRPDEYELGSRHGFEACYRQAGEYDYLVGVGDDVVFLDYWLDNALRAAKDHGNPVLVALNDGVTNFNDYAAHGLVSHDFIEKFMGGNLFPPMYKTWWWDQEQSQIAQREGCYVPCGDCLIQHLHVVLQLSDMDKTYRDAALNYDADEKIYKERKAQGFPITWAPA